MLRFLLATVRPYFGEIGLQVETGHTPVPDGWHVTTDLAAVLDGDFGGVAWRSTSRSWTSRTDRPSSYKRVPAIATGSASPRRATLGATLS